MDALKHILPKVLEKRGLKDAAEAARCLSLADAWLQRRLPQLYATTPWKILHLKDGELVIAAIHPIAAQEITMAVPDLQHYLAGELGSKPRIRVIRELPRRS